MSQLTLYLLLVVCLQTVSHLTGCSAKNASNESGQSLGDYINSQCKNKLNFKTIAEFRQFVAKFRQFDDGPQSGKPLTPVKISDILNADVGCTKETKFLDKCLLEKEAIYELEELVINFDKIRPCKMSEIEKLERFAVKYLLSNTRSIVLKFFTLFGVNVGMRCKLNLLAHLKQADTEADQLDFIYSMASPTGWNVLINEYAKKSMKLGTSAHQENQLINRIARLVPGLSQVEHLDYLNFQHPLNDRTKIGKIMEQNDGFETDYYELEQGEKWHSKLQESLEKIIESCKNLDQFYVNSVLSLARLKELGLVVEYLGDFHEHSVLLHRWLAATSFCQLMVHVKIQNSNNDSDDNNSSKDGQKASIALSIWHDDAKFSRKNRSKLYSYVSQFDEIDPSAQDKAWCASVPEGQWRQRGEAMFVQSSSNSQSFAMRQLKQFIKGLERTFETDAKNSLD